MESLMEKVSYYSNREETLEKTIEHLKKENLEQEGSYDEKVN